MGVQCHIINLSVIHSAADEVPVGELTKFRCLRCLHVCVVRGRQTAIQHWEMVPRELDEDASSTGRCANTPMRRKTFSGACYRAASADNGEHGVLYLTIPLGASRLAFPSPAGGATPTCPTNRYGYAEVCPPKQPKKLGPRHAAAAT